MLNVGSQATADQDRADYCLKQETVSPHFFLHGPETSAVPTQTSCHLFSPLFATSCHTWPAWSSCPGCCWCRSTPWGSWWPLRPRWNVNRGWARPHSVLDLAPSRTRCHQTSPHTSSRLGGIHHINVILRPYREVGDNLKGLKENSWLKGYLSVKTIDATQWSHTSFALSLWCFAVHRESLKLELLIASFFHFQLQAKTCVSSIFHLFAWIK